MKPTDVRKGSGKRVRTGSDGLTKSRELGTLPLSDAGLKRMLEEIVNAAIDISGADFGNIQLIDAKSSGLTIVAHRGFPQWWVDFWNNLPKGQGSCGASLKRRKRVIVENVEKSPIFTGKALRMQLQAGVRAVQSIPIVSRSGKPLGMFSTHYKKPHRPDERGLHLLDLLACQAADVIEQARDKAELRRSEQRFRALVTASSYVVYRMSPDWTEMRELGGSGSPFDTKPATAKWLQKYIHPDDQARVLQAVWKAIRTKSPFMFEHRVQRAEGTLGWALSRAVPLLDENGKIVEWFGSAIDVTRWKRAEAEAQAIMDVAPVAVFIARDSRCLEITGNRMAYELTRRPPGSNVSKSAPAGQRPETFRIVKNGIEIPPSELPLQKAAATGQAIHDFELDVLYQDGARRSLIGNAVPLLGTNNEPQGGVGAFLDITARKEAEEKFRVSVENAPVAIIIHDSNGRMAIVNSQAEHIFGYSREEMVGQTVEILIRPSLRHKNMEERQKYMKQPKARPTRGGLELIGRRKDGSEFPIEVSLSPLETSSGIFLSATILDLTDRKRLEEQTRLATVLEERARVARDLHDTLAQGFTGIIMNLEAAGQVSANLSDEARIRLKKAEEVARKNLEEVRHSLMELSGHLRKRPSDLVSSIRELADRAHSNGNGRLRFFLRGTPRALDAAVEENLFFIAQQAIDNAFRHAHASTVRIGLVFGKKKLQLQVQDDGRGFDVKKVEHGMGLANMRDRTQFIGGRFTLESRLGKGTRLEVRVPLLERQSREASR